MRPILGKYHDFYVHIKSMGLSTRPSQGEYVERKQRKWILGSFNYSDLEKNIEAFMHEDVFLLPVSG